MTNVVTGPLFKWFGSKWLSSSIYPAPEYDVIFEPFAGSAGYALRHYERKIKIWDDNIQVQTLWRWLIKDATTASVRAIPINIREGTDIRELGLSAGQALLLKMWQRTNNVGECWTISPWGNKPGQWTANTRTRVSEELHAVKHWELRRIEFDRPGTYFLDPPYLYNYRYRFKEEFDYGELVARIKGIPRKSQIIVCEAACQKTGRVPRYLPFKAFASRITSRRKKTENHHSKEYIYHELRALRRGQVENTNGKGLGNMAKKFALKKRPVEGNCRALRCKVSDGLVEYESLERGAVLLCPKHLQQTQDGAPTPVTPVEPLADSAGQTAVVVEHASVIALVNPLRTEYADMAEQLRAALVVNSQQRLDLAGALLKQVKGKMKELEEERKKITKPLLDAKKAVDNLFRPATDAAALVEGILKKAISDYVDGQRAAKVAALQAGDHEGALATIEPELPAGVSTRTVWKWKLVNSELVPLEYWVIDVARVQEHVNMFKGQSQIPGIEVYPETGIASGSS